MESMKGNRNAEKWTIEKATEFFEEAIELTIKKVTVTNDGVKEERYSFDFIGEVARELGSHKSIFTDLANKFPELKELKSILKSNLEANCFCNGKNGKIVPSLAIMNLKSNHGWTDRIDQTTKNKEISPQVDLSKLSESALRELANAARGSK